MIRFGRIEISRQTGLSLRKAVRLEPAMSHIPDKRSITVNLNGARNLSEISRKNTTIANENRWLKDIPEDAIITEDKAKALQSSIGRVLETLEELTPSVRDLMGPPGTFERVKNDLVMMRDECKGATVRRAMKTFAGVYGYVLFRVVGAAAVAGIPDLAPAERALDILAASALLAGEGVVRWTTGFDFAHTMLRGLARGPEYYEVSEVAMKKSAGFDLDPKNVDKPLTVYTDRKKMVTAYYIRNEQGVMERVWGHFLIEKWSRKMIMAADPPTAAMEKEYRQIVDGVRTWVEGIRKDVDSCRAALGGKDDLGQLKKLLESIAAKYREMGDTFHKEAQDKFGNMDQGSGAALDDFLAVQFWAHADKWDEKIAAIDAHISGLNSGRISKDTINNYLGGFYDYLENKFTFDIVFNMRDSKTVDLKAYGEMKNGVLARLIGSQTAINSAVNEGSFKEILSAIKQEYALKKPVSYVFSKIVDALTGGRVNKELSVYEVKAIREGRTVEKVAEELLMEEMAKCQYRRGAKAGARSNLFSKLSKTFVVYQNEFGTKLLFTKQQWQDQISKTILESNKAIKERYNTLAEACGVVTNPKLNKERAKDIIKAVIEKTGLQDKERMRVIERLEESFLNDGGNAENFLKEALIIAMSERFVEWQVFPDADYVGSYDKDYVPLSIDPYTKEYTDMFRTGVSMFEKWIKTEKRTNIAILQFPQAQQHYMKEGPMGTNGKHMNTNGAPQEGVAHVSEADQQAWYGLFVLFYPMIGILKSYVKKGKAVDDFIVILANKLYPSNEQKRNNLTDKLRAKVNADPNDDINMTIGNEILELAKREAKELVIATGIGPGRGDYRAMFSCGTCELEYVPGMLLGYHRPYVLTLEGEMLAQTEIRYNKKTGRMELYNYVPRKAGYDKEAGATKESNEGEVKLTYAITPQDKAEYESIGDIKVQNNKIFILKDGKVDKVVWWYHPGEKPAASRNDCRRVEVDYSNYNAEGKIIRDYAKDGSYYETKLGNGRIKTEVITCKQDDKDAILSNLYAQREIVGDPDLKTTPEGDLEITIKVKIPEVSTTFVSASGKYREEAPTPSVFQPDKWVTEDMATTFFHYLTGWATEVHMADVGSAVGPSDFTDIAIQHHRWFKGGPEVYLDFKKYLDANPLLKKSMQGHFMKQAFLWPFHTATDVPLYAIPTAFWAMQYLMPNGLQPLSTPLLYVPMFAFYLYQSILMYAKVMRQMGKGVDEIWMKEALLTMMGPVYNNALKMAVLREPLEFATTAAGDRKMLPYTFLKGIKQRRFLSGATAAFGAASTVSLVASLGHLLPSPVATLVANGFNILFPALKWKLLRDGVKSLYGYWTKFDAYVKERIELDGAGNITISEVDERTRAVSFIIKNKKVGPITVLSNVNSVMARIKKLAEVTDEKRTAYGDEVKVELKLQLKKDGMYTSFKKGVWVDGDVNFDHDYQIQKAAYVMTSKLKKAAGSGKTEKTLGILEDIVAKKSRMAFSIDGKLQTIKMNKEEEKVFGQYIKDIDKVNDPQLIYRSLILVAKAQLLNGQATDAAAILMKLLHTGNTGIAAKAIDNKKLDGLVARIPDGIISEQEVAGLLRGALASRDNKVHDQLLNSPVPDEAAFMDAAAKLGLVNEKEMTIKKMYGLSSQDHYKLFELCSDFQGNKVEIIKILIKVPKGNLDITVARSVGLKNSKEALELLAAGRRE